MRIFIAGATGVVGRRSAKELVGAGHEVTGVARDQRGRAQLITAGAAPVQVDLFDPEEVARAVSGHDVVINLATSIPPSSRMLLPGAWHENDRLRREASRNLVDAALRAGAGRYVQESVAFVYADGGASWLDESAPVAPTSILHSALEAETQAARFTAQGGTGLVLRFGFFYGPDSSHTRESIALVRRGIAPALGAPDGYMPALMLDDAGRAVAASLHVPAGVYNVADDEPLPRREHWAALAATLGHPEPHLPPAWVARMSERFEVLARSQRVSNRRFREASGWAPAWPSVREGWPAVVAEAQLTSHG